MLLMFPCQWLISYITIAFNRALHSCSIVPLTRMLPSSKGGREDAWNLTAYSLRYRQEEVQDESSPLSSIILLQVYYRSKNLLWMQRFVGKFRVNMSDNFEFTNTRERQEISQVLIIVKSLELLWIWNYSHWNVQIFSH